MKSQKKKYLTYLNDNYFFEVGYEKKQSNLKNVKVKKQYRTNQGRSKKQYESSYQTLKLAFVVFAISVVAYLFLQLWM
tara:strand:- start:977 stop:1210 length:234 start_codon:yes stop_codon:yes gene_type:complete